MFIMSISLPLNGVQRYVLKQEFGPMPVDAQVVVLVAGVSLFTTIIIFTAMWMVMKKKGKLVDRPPSPAQKKPEGLASLDLGRFQKKWEQEMKLRDVLLHGSNAPLRAEQAVFETAVRAAEYKFNAAVAKAVADRDSGYAAAVSERDAEYESAARDRDTEYQLAQEEKLLAQTSCGRDSTAWAAAYNNHARRWSAAYNNHGRRWAGAYNRHQTRWSATYNEHARRWSVAYAARQEEVALARAVREEAVKEYIVHHPEEVKRILGDAHQSLLVVEELASFTAVQILPIPRLVEAAAEVVSGKRNLSDEQVAALVKNLRDYLASDGDGDPNSELRKRASKLLDALAKMLMN